VIPQPSLLDQQLADYVLLTASALRTVVAYQVTGASHTRFLIWKGVMCADPLAPSSAEAQAVSGRYVSSATPERTCRPGQAQADRRPFGAKWPDAVAKHRQSWSARRAPAPDRSACPARMRPRRTAGRSSSSFISTGKIHSFRFAVRVTQLDPTSMSTFPTTVSRTLGVRQLFLRAGIDAAAGPRLRRPAALGPLGRG
jgi:hypothetical protein